MIVYTGLIAVFVRWLTRHCTYNFTAVLHNVLDSSDSVTVSGGQFDVNMNGSPKIYTPGSTVGLLAQEDSEIENDTTQPLDTDLNSKVEHDTSPPLTGMAVIESLL